MTKDVTDIVKWKGEVKNIGQDIDTFTEILEKLV